MNAPFTANEIAAYLLWRSAQEQPEEPAYLTPMQLQKLLYYIQGWSLAETGSPVFKEDLRAWRDGPVVKEVYQTYRDLGKMPIINVPSSPPELSPSARSLIENVWNRYKEFSAYKLSDLTHEEMPWKKARAGLARSEPSDIKIPLRDLEDEFKSQVARARKRLVEHAKNIRAMAQGRTRKTSPSWYTKSE